MSVKLQRLIFGTGVWYVPPDPQQQEAAMASREALGSFLSEHP